MRANRVGLSLQDSHGQILTQLALATQQDRSLLSDKKVNNEERVLDILQLRDIPRFPIRRLLTLWHNDRWQPMITRWCETAVGRDLFNISTWEWMASCRFDDVSIFPRSNSEFRARSFVRSFVNSCFVTRFEVLVSYF